MGSGDNQDILRVSATTEDIRKSYGWASRVYGYFEGLFERGMRKKGLELVSIEDGDVVLEIGIGTGFSLQQIAGLVGTTGKAYGLDITPQMLRLTEKRLRRAGLRDRVGLCQGDARTIPFEDNMFDAVYMAATLELFDTPDIPVVLGEIKRVLKPGGRLGIASMSREGRENFWFVKFYEWMHRQFPKYASCRPIYVQRAARDAGFRIAMSRELMIMKLFPMKLVLARPA